MRNRVSLLTTVLGIAALSACSKSDNSPVSAADAGPGLGAAEICDPAGSPDLVLHFDPPGIVVAEGANRPAKLVVEPDLCEPVQATFLLDGDAVIDVPPPTTLDLRHPTLDLTMTAKSRGKAKLKVSMTRPTDHVTGEASLDIEVRGPEAPTCAAGGAPSAQTLDATHLVAAGAGDLATSSVTVPSGAFTRTDQWSFPAFAATVACETNDLSAEAPGGFQKLGPAVTFTASGALAPAKILRRDVEFALPVNPAAMPTYARMRHLKILYRSPLAKTARIVPVRDPRFERDASGNWLVKFSAPFFGTFQAAVAPDAGTKKRTRHLTHRALFGFSMGGGGAASVGLRQHPRFDAVAPLGGPSDYTWLLHSIEDFDLSGFCPASNPTCPKVDPGAYPNDEPYVHTSDFNHFWYETGTGNGGDFARDSYVSLLTDLSLMLGNPNGQSTDFPFLVAGLSKTDSFVSGNVTGLPANYDCAYPVSPASTDNETLYTSLETQCRTARCDPKNAYVAKSGYYDDEYNPDGKKQVISFCDGVQNGVSPYTDTWAPAGTGTGSPTPVNYALAVDLNGNGVRDMDDPIIRKNGHEPWDDVGTDGLASSAEPGYDPVTNPDPNQDDYDPQINPNGTEHNFHYDQGEPYRDDGLDGVPGTKSLHVAGDPGEGDGAYTETDAIKNFRSVDGKAMVRRWVDPPSAPLDDAALWRLDLLTDGGVRDLFNFGAVARHFHGALASRLGADGRPLKDVAYYGGYDYLPGQKLGESFSPSTLYFDDLAGWPSIFYGNLDATPSQILDGDGQHVGTAKQILARIQMAFYYVSHGWADGDKTRSEASNGNPATATKNVLGVECEIQGHCETNFTGPKSGRTGPVAVTLPPGYAHQGNQNETYPVIFVMHGYGQDPRDLEALAIVVSSYMNDATRSSATRLAKSIVVYLDGRCRLDGTGAAECIKGNFFVNSHRPGGPQIEDWILEVMDYVDANYRTMPPSDVEVTD